MHGAALQHEEDHMTSRPQLKEWTSEKPTVTGWYWIRMKRTHEIVRVVVEENARQSTTRALLVPLEPGGEGETMDVDQMDVEWYGPLDIPSALNISAAA
jgi:hypothetical protein